MKRDDDEDIERAAIQEEGAADDEAFEEIICPDCKPDPLRPKSNIFDCRASYNNHRAKVHAKPTVKKVTKKSKKEENCDSAMMRIQASVDEEAKRNSSEDLTEKLRGSILAGTRSKEEIKMAAKKKTAAKRSNTQNGGGKKTAEAVGRERKMLLRLSNEEYKALQKQSNEKGVSMAMILRSSIKA